MVHDMVQPRTKLHNIYKNQHKLPAEHEEYEDVAKCVSQTTTEPLPSRAGHTVQHQQGIISPSNSPAAQPGPPTFQPEEESKEHQTKENVTSEVPKTLTNDHAESMSDHTDHNGLERQENVNESHCDRRESSGKEHGASELPDTPVINHVDCQPEGTDHPVSDKQDDANESHGEGKESSGKKQDASSSSKGSTEKKKYVDEHAAASSDVKSLEGTENNFGYQCSEKNVHGDEFLEMEDSGDEYTAAPSDVESIKGTQKSDGQCQERKQSINECPENKMFVEQGPEKKEDSVDEHKVTSGDVESMEGTNKSDDQNETMDCVSPNAVTFTRDECHNIHRRLEHSKTCVLKSFGGCVMCCSLRDTLLEHALCCHQEECRFPRCQNIKDYILIHGTPVSASWSYQLDKVFFSAMPPVTMVMFGDQGSITHDEVEELIQSLRPENHTARLNLSEQESLVNEKCDAYHLDRPPDEVNKTAEWQSSSCFSDTYTTSSGSSSEPVVYKASMFKKKECQGASSGLPQSPAVGQPSTIERPKQVETLISLDTKFLSVNAAGQFDEGFEWQSVIYLGGGGGGHCHLATDMRTNKLFFAIKKIKVHKFTQAELDVWSTLSGKHENILTLYGALQVDQKVIIFMQYMEGGSIESVLDGRQGPFDEATALSILCGALEGIELMHSRGILHNDIKGGNILLNDTGTRVKIADFGEAVQLQDQNFTQSNTRRGTESFMAPEVCRREPYSFSADMWSLGCVLYQMLTGQPPWMQYVNDSIIYKVATTKTPPELPDCSPEVRRLLGRMFSLKPEDRPTARELLKDPIFQSVGPQTAATDNYDGDDEHDDDDSSVLV